jgi:hypothetical protein
MSFGPPSCVRRVAVGATCVLVLAGAARADVVRQSFTSAWSPDARKLLVELQPFDAKSAGGELLSVTIELRGTVYTQFSATKPLGDEVTIRMMQAFSASLSFADGPEITSFSTKGTLQKFAVPFSSPWFSDPSMLGSVWLAPTTYAPGDKGFDLIASDASVGLVLALDGGTRLLETSGARDLGMKTGTEWTLDVSYEFVPAPSGIALAGVAFLLGSRRRR